MKILVNDGIEAIGKQMLEEAGFDVITQKIDQEDLINRLNEYDAICVRSATKVRRDLIDAAPNLKVIGRGGVGLDNIDVEYARSKGISVVNTPSASSRSVAELAMGHLLGLARHLYQANREMPTRGHQDFNVLKKEYSKGLELENKTLGIIGFGRIGQEMARVGLGLGMNILAFDPYIEEASVLLGPSSMGLEVKIKTVSMEDVLSDADFISLHTPSTEKPILGKNEFSMMKNDIILVNCSRGGTVDEDAMLEALNNGKILAAGLDVFDHEPTPKRNILSHPRVSLSPHIGASTVEAQNKIGSELATRLIEVLKHK